MKYHRLLVVLVLIALVIIVGSGFDARGDVTLSDFSTEDDGGAVTVEVGVSSPMGYVRTAKERQEGDSLYVTFYSAFGGHNGSIGARDSFELTTPDSCRAIYFYSGSAPGAEYHLVLRRDGADEDWERVGP